MDRQQVQNNKFVNIVYMCFSWRQRHHKSDQPVTAIVKAEYRYKQDEKTLYFVVVLLWSTVF